MTIDAQDEFYKIAKDFADVIEQVAPGVTPILGAVLAGKAELVERLIGAGFDPNASESAKYGVPLQAAARKGYAEIAGILVEGGANVTEKEMKAAMEGGSLECVEVLIEPYVVFCGPGNGATELLFTAIETRQPGILRALLDAPLGYEDKISVAPAGIPLPALGVAISKNSPSMVQALIDRGADIRGAVFVDNKKKSYLHYACEEAGGEVVRTLLSAGLDVNESAGGNLPIHTAVEIRPITDEIARHQLEVVQVLLDWGADITAKNAAGRTLTQIAASRSDSVRQLLASAKTAHSVEMAIGTNESDANHADADGVGAAASPRKSHGPSPL